jgi:hypothetical protein
MKKKKIEITIFKGNRGGKMTFGNGRFRRKDLTLVYRRLERKIGAWLGTCEGGKTAVIVNYPDYDGGRNETCLSSNVNYLLFCAVSFLEDYLNRDLVKGRIKKFLKGNIEP